MSAPSPVSALDSLKPLAGRALQAALNRLLDLDPDTRQALSELEERRIELALAAPPLALAITVRGGRLEVGPPINAPEADLSVRGTLAGLLGQFAAFRPRTGASAGGLKISGDADLARQLQRLAREFDPDWDRPFAQAFGEVAGAQIARVLREGLAQGRRLATGLAQDTADYLSEERRDVATGVELDTFHEHIDVLREDVDRLEHRVVRLRRLLEKGEGGRLQANE